MKVSVFADIVSLALAIAMFSPASAHQVVVGKLKIGHPWVHEAAEGAPGTYSCIIEIHNDGDEPERLLAPRSKARARRIVQADREQRSFYVATFRRRSRHSGAWERRAVAHHLSIQFGKITKP